MNLLLRELYAWRDGLARTEDESVMFVLPNHMMLKISTELPREMQGILACCNPVPPLVRQHLVLLHNIVLGAREKSVEAAMEPVMRERPSMRSELRSDSLALQHRLDLCHLEDCQGQLESLVTNKDLMTRPGKAKHNVKKKTPDLTVFAKQRQNKLKPAEVPFVSPYQR